MFLILLECFDGILLPLVCGAAVPFDGFAPVAFQASDTDIVAVPQIILGVGMALLSCLAVPFYGFFFIFLYSLSYLEAVGKVK